MSSPTTQSEAGPRAAEDAAVEAPVAEDVAIGELDADPYPIYRRLRERAAVHWVPAIGRYLVVGHQAAHTIDHDPETFTADEEGSLMKRAMGHSMLRKDDPEHAAERAALGGVLRPRAIRTRWNEVFERNFETFFRDFDERARERAAAGDATLGGDVHRDFAEPYAAENLREILGLDSASWQDIRRWSRDLIAATGNYADDPAVWERGRAAFDEVDAAIDDAVDAMRRQDRSETLLAHLVSAGLPMHSVRANIKMTIGGGFNEPRDALGTTLWALLRDRDQFAHVQADADRGWDRAFDESVRWVAPIGMYSRQTTVETVVDGVRLPAGAKLGVAVAAANRDPAQHADPETFDITREPAAHLGFGAGTHYCAGAWVARAQVARVALPRLVDRLPGVRLDPDRPARAGGWVFRGMLTLPVQWDRA